MAMPSRDLGDPLVTDWTQTALLFPEMNQPLFPFQGVYHFHVKTFLIVAFPFGVIWISLSTDFCVPFDRHLCGVCEIMRLFVYGSEKHPVVSCDGLEVFLRNPCIRLLWVFPFHPSSHCSIDLVIYRVEGFFAHHMLVIVGPSLTDGIKLDDQFSSTESFIGLHDLPYLFQEGLNILLRRFDQQFVSFPCLVLAYILAQEVEACFDMRDNCFLRRELQSSFSHELLHERFD